MPLYIKIAVLLKGLLCDLCVFSLESILEGSP